VIVLLSSFCYNPELLLWNDVFVQTDVQEIYKRIESLIGRAYLERSKDDVNILMYLEEEVEEEEEEEEEEEFFY
jgi:hypothetical protein